MTSARTEFAVKSFAICFFFLGGFFSMQRAEQVARKASPIQEKTLISLGEFTTAKVDEHAKTSQQLYEVLRNALQKKGFRIQKAEGKGRRQRLQNAKAARTYLYIDGLYMRNAKTQNLDLYVQFYDPEKEIVIDAYSKTDKNLNSLGLELDAEEIKEADSGRIEEFVAKILVQLRSNPDKKERRNNISEHILLPQLEKKYFLPIVPEKKSSQAKASDVFNLLQEQQIITSSTKTAKKVNEAPNVASVIADTENIEYGRISINDILYSLPGFAPSRDYDRRTVSARGMFEGWNNNHLLLLMDGVQFNDSLYGSAYTWEVMPLNMVKSVEVIRGPGSALYGANATNGVISLNTYSGEDLAGELRTRLRLGDYGNRIYELLHGDRSKYVSYVVSYRQFETHGHEYQDRDGSFRQDIAGSLANFQVNDSRRSSYIFSKLEGVDSLAGLSLQFHRQDWEFETGHGWLWRIPDANENLSESLDTTSVKYKSDLGDKLSQEYVLRYQIHSIDWNMRYGENGSYDGFYPAGVWEYLETDANEVLARAQYTYTFANGGSFLAGVEASRFLYTGDDAHFSNIDLADSANGFPPYGDGLFRPQGPWLEWIQSQPIPKGAVFAQLISGKIWQERFELTLGLRYDEKYARFKGIDQPYSSFLPFPYIPEERRVFRRTSPRAGLVFFASNTLTFKLMAGTAFREPSITELFGANTFTLAADPRKLKPEIITTREFAIDYSFSRHINFRTNLFQNLFENQIAYSTANNNLSTNIYTLHTRGLEAELITQYHVWHGFLNYSYSQRIQEHILDNTVSRSADLVTWAPKTVANLGVRYHWNGWLFSTSVHRQGKVYRRVSDMGTIDEVTGFLTTYSEELLPYRSKVVPAWTDVNLRVVYEIWQKIRLGVSFSNLFNTRQALIKNNYYPFDYQRERRRFLVDMQATF